MRVLVLAYETPAYPAGGGPSRLHCLLEPLAARHDVHVISTGGPPRFGRLPDGVGITLLDSGDRLPPITESWLRKNVVHYARGRPWIHRPAAHHLRTLAGALPAALRDLRPDLVEVEHGELASLLGLVPRSTATVLSLHNLLTDVQRQNIRGRGPWEAIKAVLEIGVCARAERDDARRASRVVVTTELDRRRLRRLAPRAAIDVVTNCVDVRYWARTGAPRAARPVAVMTASYHYAPNLGAALHLIDTVWPLVRERVPDAELRLVGQGMPEILLARAEEASGVVAVGAVDDVRPELHGAWVALAPLRQGSGSPLKVLEALAAETPVVATVRVGRALGLGEAEGVVCASGDDGIAAAVARLLRDPRRLDALGVAGRDAVASRHSRERGAETLERCWLAAAG